MKKCAKLRSIFSRLDYPWSLIDSVVSNFDSRKPSVTIAERNVTRALSFNQFIQVFLTNQ